MTFLQSAVSTLTMLFVSLTLGVIGYFHFPQQAAPAEQTSIATTTTSPQGQKVANSLAQTAPTQTNPATPTFAASPERITHQTTTSETEQSAYTPPTQPSNEAILLILSELGAQASSAGSPPSFNEGGYSIEIPSDFIYFSPMVNYDIWYSRNIDELITVQWDTDSSSSQLRRLEDTQLEYAGLAKSRPAMSPVTISHPAVKGAPGLGSLIGAPEYYSGASSRTLFITGSDGTIYKIGGLSSSPTSEVSIVQIIDSFALTK